MLALAGGMACAQPLPAPSPAAPLALPVPGAAAAASAPLAVSASAQRIYERARSQLLQVRTLLKGQDSQASVGSGFLVSEDGLILTNYHVVSQAALQPERYRLTYTRVDGREGPLLLLGFDAIHDLALVKALPASSAGKGAAGGGVAALGTPLAFRPPGEPLSQGNYVMAFFR